MRKLLLLFACLISAFAFADDVTYFTITANGSPISFPISEQTIITYADNVLVISTDENRIEIPVVDISSFVFNDEDVPTSIGKEQEQRGRASLFKGLKPGSLVQVLTPNGVVVQTVEVPQEGIASLHLQTLPKGVYLVRTSAQTIKIINK